MVYQKVGIKGENEIIEIFGCSVMVKTSSD